MKRYINKQRLSLLVITAIWILCLMPAQEFPKVDFTMADKWTHFVMYASLTVVIMWEYGREHKKICWRRFFVGAILLPVVMGGLVELAQAYLTNGNRSGDWFDFLANSIGVLIGCLIGIPLARVLSTRNKD